MTQLVTRSQWGARPRESGTTAIVDHPSVTFHYVGGGWEYPWPHSSCDDKVRAIQADHMDNRGWSDIAYNYLPCPHDYVYEGRGYDRRSSANGDEAPNNLSFAVCALWGTASADDPLPDGLKFAFMFARNILRVHGGATSVIKGHRDWKQTDCPGNQIYAWIQAGCPLPSTGEPDMTTDASVRAIVKDELTKATADGGAFHEVVQAFSGWNAENLRQRIDDIGNFAANATDLVLKDDFTALGAKVTNLGSQLENLQDNQAEMKTTLTAILNKLNNPPA